MQRAALLIAPLVLCASLAYGLSYEKEREIADEFITTLEGADLIVHNREITWILQQISDQLAARIDAPMYPFYIHLVKDRSVNAFAIPDGHIFINLGTLLFARDIDEIASVIGHEMGHCQLRHIHKAYETQKRISTASIVGLLLGTLLSTQNPEIGTALILSSIGGGENVRLSYTRKHEYEADEFSRNILPEAGFDPSAMSRFLIALRTYSGASLTPEYLLTHPYTADRIAAVQREADQAHPDTRYWNLSALTIGLLLPVQEVATRSQTLPAPYDRLALGLAKVRAGKTEEALTLLTDIPLPEARAYLGLALYRLGEADQAWPYLKSYGRSAETGLALAEIMEARGQLQEAIAALKPYKKQHPRVDFMLGGLYERTSQTGYAHAAYARYFLAKHNEHAAGYHIDEALRHKETLDEETLHDLEQLRKKVKKVGGEKP